MLYREARDKGDTAGGKTDIFLEDAGRRMVCWWCVSYQALVVLSISGIGFPKFVPESFIF